jgi:hypothetical protein
VIRGAAAYEHLSRKQSACTDTDIPHFASLAYAVVRLLSHTPNSAPMRRFSFDRRTAGLLHGPFELYADSLSVFRITPVCPPLLPISGCHREEPRDCAALLRRAKHLGSLDRNAISRDAASYLELERAGRVIEC